MSKSIYTILGLLLVISILTGCAPSASADSVTATEESALPESTDTPEPTSPPPTAEPTTTQEADASPAPTEAAESTDSAADSTPEATAYPEAWMNLPVVPAVSQTAADIYQRGLVMGNNPYSFSIIGDCQSVLPMFLASFERSDQYTLGEEYAYLQDVIDNFAGSFYRDRYAVGPGCNVAAVHSTMWADPEVCLDGETPLDCEFRVHNPSIALISMETNYPGWNLDTYRDYLGRIVEFCIDEGVVPILGTKADNTEGDGSRNALVVEIAQEYDVPVWNFWAAAQPLPGHGVNIEEGDAFHLTYAVNDFSDPEILQHGWPVRNLTALQALDAVWRTVTAGE